MREREDTLLAEEEFRLIFTQVKLHTPHKKPLKPAKMPRLRKF